MIDKRAADNQEQDHSAPRPKGLPGKAVATWCGVLLVLQVWPALGGALPPFVAGNGPWQTDLFVLAFFGLVWPAVLWRERETSEGKPELDAWYWTMRSGAALLAFGPFLAWSHLFRDNPANVAHVATVLGLCLAGTAVVLFPAAPTGSLAAGDTPAAPLRAWIGLQCVWLVLAPVWQVLAGEFFGAPAPLAESVAIYRSAVTGRLFDHPVGLAIASLCSLGAAACAGRIRRRA